MKRQIYNPYLPTFEYIPDGEPHVFDGRLYLFGSHDRFGGSCFCLNDYVCYSAPVDDLSDWRYEGIIYRKEQDPRNQNIPADAPVYPEHPDIAPRTPQDLNLPGIHAMWAPDVLQGPDGRYYLYYCLDFLPEIGVAVSDRPAGPYEFLGFVRHPDGTVLGQRPGDLQQFDPGLFMDDDGTIYLFSGNAPMKPEYAHDHQDSQVMQLEYDMLTLKTEPKKLMLNILESSGSGFEGHEFFEASSLRKINGKYYFIYSSVNSHELCYAVSDFPDREYHFGGTIIDIGDVYLEGRTEKQAVNCLGNTHGGIENVNGQWYVFYHRQTNRTNYSRQACAEKICFNADGHIHQAEVTSCGLNPTALPGTGTYPAAICCHLTGAKGAVFSHPTHMGMDYPFLTQDIPDSEPTARRMAQDLQEPFQYICNIKDGSTAGYKYFSFNDLNEICIEIRGTAHGCMEIRTEENGAP